MSKILFTGSTGFAGARTLRALSQEHEVYAVVRSEAQGSEQIGAIPLIADLSAPFSTRNWPTRIDVVVHMAQSRHYRSLPERSADVFAVNTAATQALLSYAVAAQARRFVHVSTGGVYAPQEGAIREETMPRPRDLYTLSKCMAEALVLRHADRLSPVVLRPFFIYGPGQRDMLVPRLLDRVLSRETVRIAGDPGIRTRPTFVDDFTAAVKHAVANPASGVFNIAGDEPITIRGLVEALGHNAGLSPSIDPAPADADGDLLPETRRMRHVLGVRPETPLAEGLRRTVAARLVEVAP